ncbi:MAG: TerB family tellurite resistance protein [Candidatus Aminicenantes bacterium]|nr:TerB family tellurite resistance protein [Candidatus Aminicenantes bacterium]
MRNWKERLLKSLSVESVQGEFERFDRIQIASCVILLEVAKFDFDFSSIEKETTKAILKNEFAIPEDAIEDLMKISEEKREDSVDLWEFTNVINQNFSREEKIKIIEAAWKIIYADDKLDKYENHYVHVLADLLRLRHDELIDAKLNVLYGIRNEKEEDQENDDDDDDDKE